MEAMIQELSKMFDVTVEVAQDMYPIIRQQVVIYNVTRTAIVAVLILLVLSMILSFVGSLIYVEDKDYWEKETVKKIRKILISIYVTTILLVFAAFALYTIMNVYAADFILLRMVLA